MMLRYLLLLTAVANIAWSQSSSVGPVSYERYIWPGQCVYMLKRMENDYWRDKILDTAYSSSLGHVPQQSSLEEAKRCLSHFSIEKSSERDLFFLGYAYLAANDDNKAEEAFRRLLSFEMSKPVSQRAWTISQIVSLYSTASPVRITKATDYAARLDALGTTAAMARLMAHLSIYNRARVMDSIPLMEKEAKAAIKAGNEISVDSVKRERAEQLVDARMALAHVYMRRGDLSQAISTLKTAITELTPLRRKVRIPLQSTIRRYSIIGKHAPSLKAKAWFNDTHNGVYPASGRISLITFVSPSCGGDLSDCYPGYAVLKRLKSQPYSQSLDIVLVMRTEGYYRNDIVEPAKEIEYSRQYFLDYLKLPGTLGIWQTDFGFKPDERLDVLSNPNEEAYNPAPPLETYIVDKSGIVRYVTWLNKNTETEVNKFIEYQSGQ